MRLLKLLITILLAVQVHAAAQLSNLFTVDSTCNTAVVDAMLSETIDYTNAAISAIKTLLAASLSLNPAIRSTKVTRYLEAANAAFGIPLPGIFSTGLPSADKVQLTSALQNYQALLNTISNQIGITPVNNVFWCDSSTMVLTDQANDIFNQAGLLRWGPGPPNALSASNNPTVTDLQLKVRGGVTPAKLWKDTDLSRSDQYGANWLLDENNGAQICNGRTQGETFNPPGRMNMFLCPEVFNPANFKQSLASLTGTEQDAKWDQIKSLPGVFLHEMMHWLKVTPHIGDQQILGSPAYGLTACWVLGGQGTVKSNRALNIINADCYAVFATMAYLPLTNFIG